MILRSQILYSPAFFFGDAEWGPLVGLPKSRYRLSESALPEELEDEEDVRDDTLLIDLERDLDGDPMDRARPSLGEPDLDLEKELEEPERDLERDRLDPLELALGFGLGKKETILS
nr:hypothetical protein BaRGS_014530 [Batillaria attramentaria]